MKKYALSATVLAAAVSFAFAACSEDNGDSENTGSCTVSTCKDASTLLVCNNGTSTPQSCPNGCENGACKTIPASKCTANVCQDINTLLVCDTATGNTTPQSCPNGCDGNACKTTPDAKCTANVCKDTSTLLICITATGEQSPLNCPNGCENGACKSAPETKCTANSCQDENTLLVCDTATGKTTTQTCPNGCDIDACRTTIKCTESTCQDAQVLLFCNKNTGSSAPVTCPSGCENGACKNTPSCTDACKDSTTLNQCDPTTGLPFAYKCPDGYCAEGRCLAKSEIIGKPCTTETDPFCEGNDLVYCAETSSGAVWTRSECPTNYQCSAYDGEPMCREKCTTAGTSSTSCGTGFQVSTICTKTDEGMLYIRDDSSLKECEFGCADNKVCVTSGNCIESCLSSTSAVVCTDGYASTFVCDSGKTCIMGSDKKSKCGYSCTPDTAVKNRCYFQYPDNPSMGESSYAQVECREGASGSYGYEIVNFTKCTNGCKDDTGCY